MTRRPGTNPPVDHGQATVELALSLPVVCMLLFAVVQVAVVGRDHLAVQFAARAAARAASVSANPTSAGTMAAHSAITLRPLSVRITEGDGTVTAFVQYTDPTDVPLVGAVLPELALSATVTMAVEPP